MKTFSGLPCGEYLCVFLPMSSTVVTPPSWILGLLICSGFPCLVPSFLFLDHEGYLGGQCAHDLEPQALGSRGDATDVLRHFGGVSNMGV